MKILPILLLLVVFTVVGCENDIANANEENNTYVIDPNIVSFWKCVGFGDTNATMSKAKKIKYCIGLLYHYI